MDPFPELDPAVEAKVRALLAQAPEPVEMPREVSDRIETALAGAARLRVQPGPLSAPGADGSATPDEALGATVTALPARNRPPRPLQLAAAVAAAVVVVAGGASMLHATQRPNGAAVVGGLVSTPPSQPPSETPVDPATNGGGPRPPHIQLSTTAYDSGNLAGKARELLDHPGMPLQDLAAESPHLGPIATPIGLQSCLSALGVTDPAAVSADLATFEGRPAAIVVVTRDGTSTAWAVERSCAPGQPGILRDATQVP